MSETAAAPAAEAPKTEAPASTPAPAAAVAVTESAKAPQAEAAKTEPQKTEPAKTESAPIDPEAIKAEALKAYQESSMAEIEKIQAGWFDAAKADKLLAGEDGTAFEANVQKAHALIAKYGDAESKAWLEASKLGNFPPLLRIFARIAQAAGEDRVVGASATATKSPNQVLSERYPSML